MSRSVPLSRSRPVSDRSMSRSFLCLDLFPWNDLRQGLRSFHGTDRDMEQIETGEQIVTGERSVPLEQICSPVSDLFPWNDLFLCLDRSPGTDLRHQIVDLSRSVPCLDLFPCLDRDMEQIVTCLDRDWNRSRPWNDLTGEQIVPLERSLPMSRSVPLEQIDRGTDRSPGTICSMERSVPLSRSVPMERSFPCLDLFL